MNTPARTTPPAAPAANAIGVVPRWKATLAVTAAFVLGRWGIGGLAIAAIAAVACAALVLEAQRRTTTPWRPPTGPARSHVRTLQEGDHR